MKGDFTRDTFKHEKHYSGVRQQQGRVQLDADWNEQLDVQTRLDRTTNVDFIGPSGAPHTGGGFKIGVAAGNTDLTLSPGHIYVDGIHCQLEEKAPPITYRTQPDFPDPPALNVATGRTDLVYLDVWERLVTAVEDPSIREVALGGSDTATRTQIVWQVKVSPNQPAGVTCKSARLPQPGSGRLSTQLQEMTPPTNPCTLGPAGGYRGLENHLYRVEIHTGGNLGTATFKWSRENGSVVFAIDEFVSGHPEQVRIKSLGKDQMLGLKIGDWVEVLDDRAELKGPSGTLAKINAITPHPDGGFVLKLSANVVAYASSPTPFTHPKLRRWDQVLNVEADGSVKINANAATIFNLENGLQVKFSGSDFRPGDYWIFSARSTDGSFEKLIDSPIHGTLHHCCPLALITWQTSGPAMVHDCRPEFPSLTELTSFFVAGGDGQEAMPGNALPDLLQVGVANGQWPVSGARVRLQAEAGGKLAANPGSLAAGTDTLEIATGPDGIASVAWQLAASATAPTQQVVARLLDDEGTLAPNPPLRFTGNLSIASQVAYDPGRCGALEGQNTVQKAIERLTSLVRFEAVGGDGQDVEPGEPLANPIQVLVTSACGPVTGAKIVFEDVDGGIISLKKDFSSPQNPLTLVTTIIDKGIATVYWQPNANATSPAKELTATLYVQDNSLLMPPGTLRFTANLRFGKSGGCCLTVGPGGDFRALDVAFEKLLPKESDICLCLLPGTHILDKGLIISAAKATGPVHVRINGCGPGSRVELHGGPLIAEKISSLSLANLEIEAYDIVNPFQFRRCEELVMQNCRLATSTVLTDLLTIEGAGNVIIQNCRLESLFYWWNGDPCILCVKTIPEFKFPPLSKRLTGQQSLVSVEEIAKELARVGEATLKKLIKRWESDQAQKRLGAKKYSDAVNKALKSLEGLAKHENPDERLAVANRSVGLFTYGAALVLTDSPDSLRIENTDFMGRMHLFGNGPDLALKEILALAAQIGGNKRKLTESKGKWYLHHNQFLDVTLDKSLLKAEPEVLPGMPSNLWVADNIVTYGNLNLIAQQMDCSHNQFQSVGIPLAVLAGNAGVIVGNSASSNDPTQQVYAYFRCREALLNANIKILP